MGKKNKRRNSPPPLAETGQPVAHKRRVPRPPRLPQANSFLIPVSPPRVTNPYAVEIAAHIQRACNIARLNPYTVLNDFFLMFRWMLALDGENEKAIAKTGRPNEDPPEVQAIFRRARERFEQASLQYPAAYRAMQTAYFQMINLLNHAFNEVSLDGYAQQFTISADILGEVFLVCLQPGEEWWPYFPLWNVALSVARNTIPRANEMVYQELARANLRYADANPENPIKLVVGENFEEWYLAVLPYCETLVIPSHSITSPAMLLALAAQFPEWARKSPMLYFTIQHTVPIIQTINEIYAMRHGLNGYALQRIRDAVEAAEFFAERGEIFTEVEADDLELITPPMIVGNAAGEFLVLRRPIVAVNLPPDGAVQQPEPAAEEEAPSSPPTWPGGPSFEQLFRKT
ncbi:MAG: hypothetical protein BroJett011_42930 [Chloroflexota bacterium]|nr:MAG: hypothetical protein BroJett011_42930 [Chloroflexota bacterium]